MIDKELCIIAIDQAIQALGTFKAALGEVRTKNGAPTEAEVADEKNTLLGDAMESVETFEAEIIPAKEPKTRKPRKPKAEGTPVGVVDQPEIAKAQNIDVVKADEANQINMFDDLLPQTAPDMVAAAPVETTKDFSEDEVRKKIVSYAQKNGADKAYSLISNYGSNKLDGLTKAKRNELGSFLVTAGF